MRTTRKQISQLAYEVHAEDVTSHKDRKHTHYREIAYSMGLYGCNACIWQDIDTGEFFYCPSRSTALFIYM